MKNILVEKAYRDHIALIRLNRPEQLNALNPELLHELDSTISDLNRNDKVRVIILSGNEKAFAAGADIKQMADKSPLEMEKLNQFSTIDRIATSKKPLIAAVSGFALGGGCELAMACDLIIAGASSKFGQPEIKLGVIPGAGGTQRLTRAIGKAKAMELILTGDIISADEALKLGLINKVVADSEYLDQAVAMAEKIAKYSPVATKLAIESVNKSYETGMSEGLIAERKNFYLTFASEDQKEGMRAFIDKRKPDFKGK